ncbi:MAG: cupin domain-containing protein [Deltaproteobacteria bacterium]|nr:cupin domain-containing protein [Deltaproteobacteria bacterium]
MTLTKIEKSVSSANSGKEASKLKPGEAIDIAGLVSYGEGSIVSRTLVNNSAGTITLFAFDQGQGLSEHTAPFDALVHVVEGESEVIIDGKTNRVCEGQIIMMPANIPHALNAVRPFKMILTMVRK